MNRDHHVLWELTSEGTATACVMVSCCDEEIVLRELYPDRSSLYERARELQTELTGEIRA